MERAILGWVLSHSSRATHTHTFSWTHRWIWRAPEDAGDEAESTTCRCIPVSYYPLANL